MYTVHHTHAVCLFIGHFSIFFSYILLAVSLCLYSEKVFIIWIYACSTAKMEYKKFSGKSSMNACVLVGQKVTRIQMHSAHIFWPNRIAHKHFDYFCPGFFYIPFLLQSIHIHCDICMNVLYIHIMLYNLRECAAVTLRPLKRRRNSSSTELQFVGSYILSENTFAMHIWNVTIG